MSLAESVARLALSTFDKLPPKCKPRVYPDGRREWTPMSAIVVGVPRGPIDNGKWQEQTTSQTLWPPAGGPSCVQLKCISLGTGTKCLPASTLPKCKGAVLHDCHAEILAIRGLNRWLLDEAQRLLTDPTYISQVLEQARESPCDKDFGNEGGLLNDSMSSDEIAAVANLRVFQTAPEDDAESDNGRNMAPRHTYYKLCLRSGISFHLFSTEAPCGDASMELLMSSRPVKDAVPWELRTCSTSTVSSANLQKSQSPTSDGPNVENKQLLGRGFFSILGAVRRKPARADAEATTSKSCTDKLALKQFTSLLSFPTNVVVDCSRPEAFLKSVIVYEDHYHAAGYERAVSRRGRLRRIVSCDAGEGGNDVDLKEGESPPRDRTVPTTCTLQARFFDIDTLPEEFPRFSFERSRNSRLVTTQQPGSGPMSKASNVCALWIAGSGSQAAVQEVLINGVRQGCKQFEERRHKESVVCRRQMWEKTVQLSSLMDDFLGGDLEQTTYSQAKQRWKPTSVQKTKSLVTTKLGGWSSCSMLDDFHGGDTILKSSLTFQPQRADLTRRR